VDTRTKIIGADRVAEFAASGALIVSGYFDPLVSSLAERLAALKCPDVPLVVLIRTPHNPILSAPARAELVAALSAVDYVCDVDTTVEPSLSLESEHRQRLTDLIAHVHARQKTVGRESLR
jgi:hypothetical protein